MSERKEIPDVSNYIKVYSDPLPIIGTIDLLSIRSAKGLTGQANLSTLASTNINPYEDPSRKPNGSPPYSMTDFRGYRHKCLGVSQDSFSLNYQTHQLTVNLINYPATSILPVWYPSWITVLFLPDNSAITINVDYNHTGASRSETIQLFSNDLVIPIQIVQLSS